MKEQDKKEEEILNLAFPEGWGFGDPDAKYLHSMQVDTGKTHSIIESKNGKIDAKIAIINMVFSGIKLYSFSDHVFGHEHLILNRSLSDRATKKCSN